MIAKRNYVVPLRRKYANTQRPQRAKKAMSVLKEFLSKHMKSEEIRIAGPLNDFIWQNGIKNPPGKVAIVAEKNDEGIVFADLEGNKLPSELEESKEAEPEKKEEKKSQEPKKSSEEKESENKAPEKKSTGKKEEKSETKSDESKSEKKSEE